MLKSISIYQLVNEIKVMKHHSNTKQKDKLKTYLYSITDFDDWPREMREENISNTEVIQGEAMLV